MSIRPSKKKSQLGELRGSSRRGPLAQGTGRAAQCSMKASRRQCWRGEGRREQQLQLGLGVSQGQREKSFLRGQIPEKGKWVYSSGYRNGRHNSSSGRSWEALQGSSPGEAGGAGRAGQGHLPVCLPEASGSPTLQEHGCGLGQPSQQACTHGKRTLQKGRGQRDPQLS